MKELPGRVAQYAIRSARYVTHHLALKWRLMLMLALLIIVSFAAVGVISVRIYSANIIGQTIESRHEMGASTLEAIGSIRVCDEYIAQQVVRNDSIMGALSYSGPQTPTLHFQEVVSCSTALIELVDKKNIVGLAVMGNNGKSFFSKSETDTTNMAALQQLIYPTHLQDTAAKSVWIPSHADIFSSQGGGANDPTLYVASKLYYARSLDTAQAVGFSVMQVQYGRFADILSRTISDRDSYVTLADGGGTILCTTGSSSSVGGELPAGILSKLSGAAQGSFSLKEDRNSILYLFNRDSTSGWVMIQAIPYAQIAGAASEVRRWIMLVIALFVAASLALAWLFAKTFSNPVVKLEKVMARFGGGQLSVRAATDRSDEIGHLQSSFNSMADQINTLLQGMEEENRQKRTLEIRMLEYQINPHFLYNSLDSINWMATSAGNREISELASALARFFRIGLSRGREVVSVAEELEHVKNYLVISKIRYHDGFDFNISADPEILECRIVKLILQPLAENVLVHAISKTASSGHVEIRAVASGDRIAIEVEDNGKGIPPDRLEVIRAMLSQKQKSGDFDGGIGLSNVQQRIRLCHGPEYGLELESTVGKGTIVRVILPRER